MERNSRTIFDKITKIFTKNLNFQECLVPHNYIILSHLYHPVNTFICSIENTSKCLFAKMISKAKYSFSSFSHTLIIISHHHHIEENGLEMWFMCNILVCITIRVGGILRTFGLMDRLESYLS